MPEERTVRIPESVALELEAKQKAIRAKTGKKPSLGNLLVESMARHSDSPSDLAKGISQADIERITISKHQRWTKRLIEILESGDKDAISAVTQNIAVFLELVRLRRAKHGQTDQVSKESPTPKKPA